MPPYSPRHSLSLLTSPPEPYLSLLPFSPPPEPSSPSLLHPSRPPTSPPSPSSSPLVSLHHGRGRIRPPSSSLQARTAPSRYFLLTSLESPFFSSPPPEVLSSSPELRRPTSFLLRARLPPSSQAAAALPHPAFSAPPSSALGCRRPARTRRIREEGVARGRGRKGGDPIPRHCARKREEGRCAATSGSSRALTSFQRQRRRPRPWILSPSASTLSLSLPLSHSPSLLQTDGWMDGCICVFSVYCTVVLVSMDG